MDYPFELPCPVDRIEVMGPHMTKHHLNDGRVLHHFTQPDSGPPHDHPWMFNSKILHGGYVEDEYHIWPNGTHELERHVRFPGESHDVQADTVHRIVELLDKDCWTIIDPGKKEKEPGFYDFRPDGIFRRDWNGEWLPFSPKKSAL